MNVAWKKDCQSTNGNYKNNRITELSTALDNISASIFRYFGFFRIVILYDVIDFTIFLLVSNANLYFIKPPANKPYVKNAKIFHKWPVFD